MSGIGPPVRQTLAYPVKLPRCEFEADLSVKLRQIRVFSPCVFD